MKNSTTIATMIGRLEHNISWKSKFYWWAGELLPRGENDNKIVASSIETSVCGRAIGGIRCRCSLLTTSKFYGLGCHRESADRTRGHDRDTTQKDGHRERERVGF